MVRGTHVVILFYNLERKHQCINVVLISSVLPTQFIRIVDNRFTQALRSKVCFSNKLINCYTLLRRAHRAFYNLSKLFLFTAIRLTLCFYLFTAIRSLCAVQTIPRIGHCQVGTDFVFLSNDHGRIGCIVTGITPPRTKNIGSCNDFITIRTNDLGNKITAYQTC